MAAHAILSPSAASRWLACTRSARLEKTFPDNSGEAAAEGTLAHSLAELMIRRKDNRVNELQYKAKLRPIQKHQLYSAEMLDYMDDYSSLVIEHYLQAQARTSDAVLFLETRYDMTQYVPEGFGTGDVTIIAEGHLHIIDLKYGKGVPVDATQNKQLMLYALGALLEYDYLYGIETLTLTIAQPRLQNWSSWEITTADLLQWAETELRPKAALAYAGEGEFQPGEHCRFCRARATCRANADFNLQLAKHDYCDPDVLTDDEFSDVLGKVDLLRKWVDGVEKYALQQALRGKAWPNWKLVEGRSVRVVKDPAATADALLQAGYDEAKVYKPRTMLGITELEKAIGKHAFAQHVAPRLIKPTGKPALVPASDKRPALNSAEQAAEDFGDDFTEDDEG